VVICVLALLAFAVARDLESPAGYSYDEYLTDFEKAYETSEDYAVHRAIYERNVASIISHNADKTQTWKKGVNFFTDMSTMEMRKYFGYNAAAARARRLTTPMATIPDYPLESLPTAVDWRDKGVISPVKNQGGCGSCWAFAGTEAMETSVAQETGRVVALSTQNVVSCAPNPHHCGGTGGCGGATADIAYEYTIGHGVASEAAYPYRAQTGTCNESIPKTARIKGFVKVAENNYTQIMNALAGVAPLAVNVDANPWGSYSSGVFTGCQFRDIDVNHVVQVVGYGTDAARGKDYWIVRNSWGAGWGEKGYMRLERHSDGDMKKWCGPDTRPQDGTGCDGGPAVVTACGSCGIWYDASYATGGSLV